MSGEPILITLETTTGAPSSLPVVLKKIMEMPPPNILDGDDGKCGKIDAGSGMSERRCRLKTRSGAKKSEKT